MQKLKVENMESTRSGKTVANQFIIRTIDGEYFQSYRSVIAFKPRSPLGRDELRTHKVMLDETYWNYSRTTAKYRNEFLGETTEEIKEKINSGEYLLVNLNA